MEAQAPTRQWTPRVNGRLACARNDKILLFGQPRLPFVMKIQSKFFTHLYGCFIAFPFVDYSNHNGGVPKWLREGSAKPSFIGSNPIAA